MTGGNVKRTGGVAFGGGNQPIGTPSKVPGVRPDEAGFNVAFDRDKFTNAIERHGLNVLWQKSTFCPFLKGPNPKDHDITCTVCDGGNYYFDSKPTKMLITSMSLAQQYFAYGRFASGKAQITALPTYKISFWDKVTLCDSRMRVRDIVHRQRGVLVDQFKYIPICVENLIWNNNGVIATATQDVDFTLAADSRNVTWLTSNRPNADTYYSVVYYYHPSYIVVDEAHGIRDIQQPNPPSGSTDTQYEFPVQVVGQLDQFVRNEGRDPNDEGVTQNPFPSPSSPFNPSA